MDIKGNLILLGVAFALVVAWHVVVKPTTDNHNLMLELLLAGILGGVIRVGIEIKCLRETLAKREKEMRDS